MISKLLRLSCVLFLIGNAIAAPRPAIQCINQGWQYAVFTKSGNNDDENIKQTLAAGGGTNRLITSGVTATIGGINENKDPIRIYRNPTPIRKDGIAVVHRGYLFATTTGLYNISVPAFDDTILLWAGDAAKSGWNVGNTAFYRLYGQSACGTPINGPGYGSVAIYLTQGQYMPMRLMLVQAGGDVILSASITGPGGNVLFNSTYSDTNSIMQYSCDGTSAPPFPGEWGKES